MTTRYTGNNSQFDFVGITKQARLASFEESDVPTSGRAVQLPSLFDTEEVEEKSPYIKEGKPELTKLGVETYMVFNSKVFVLYKPWETCSRCQEAAKAGQLDLDSGDYTCPHTGNIEYQDIINMTLKGDSVLTTREFFTDMVGVRRVHVEWLTPDEKRKAELLREEKAKKDNQVYPPKLD
jgi:hypothetical protein